MAKRNSPPKRPDTASDATTTPKKATTTRAKRETPEEARPVETPYEPYEPTEDEIRHRAYQRYLERGDSPGSEFDDWLYAEQDLRRKR